MHVATLVRRGAGRKVPELHVLPIGRYMPGSLPADVFPLESPLHIARQHTPWPGSPFSSS